MFLMGISYIVCIALVQVSSSEVQILFLGWFFIFSPLKYLVELHIIAKVEKGEPKLPLSFYRLGKCDLEPDGAQSRISFPSVSIVLLPT